MPNGSDATLETFRLSGDQQIYVEVLEPTSEEYRRVAKSDVPRSYSDAIAKLRPAADELLEMLKGLVSKPRTVEIEFGVKLTGSLGAIIASATGEGNFKIKLVWDQGSG